MSFLEAQVDNALLAIFVRTHSQQHRRSLQAQVEKHMHHEKLLYDLNETMAALGIGRTSLYEELRARRLEARKYGKKLLFTAASIRKFAEELPKFASEAA